MGPPPPRLPVRQPAYEPSIIPVEAPTIQVRPAVNPPPKELPPENEGRLLSIIGDLKTELREMREDRERLRRELEQKAEEAPPREEKKGAKKKTSVFDSLRPTTRGGKAIALAGIVTAAFGGMAAVVTALGGGEGLAQVLHAPKLREQIEAARTENAELKKSVDTLKADLAGERSRNAERFRFIGAALCKGANVNAKGLDCDAVQWEPRPVLKRGEAPPPWRARDYRWPPEPP